MSKIIINGKSDGSLKAYANGEEVNSIMAGGACAYVRMETESEPEPPTPAGPNYLCFTANTGGSTIWLEEYGYTGLTPLIYFSTDDKQTWTQWDFSTITLANAGDKVYMKGTNSAFALGSAEWGFHMTGSVAGSGDITTLLDENGTDTLEQGMTFSYMFQGCTSLTEAPVLPATTLATSCYSNMFKGCTSLTAAPALPATTLAGACYESMFSGCKALTAAPELPATTLAERCYYQMFYGCTSLTSATALPATTLANYCYQGMFKNCTSLTAAPELPATTLAERCYYQMFYGCSNIASVKIGILTWNTYDAYKWLENTANRGTVYAPVNSDISNYQGNNSGVPFRWTITRY